MSNPSTPPEDGYVSVRRSDLKNPLELTHRGHSTPPEPGAVQQELLDRIKLRLEAEARKERPDPFDSFRLGYDSALMDFKSELLAALSNERFMVSSDSKVQFR